ncbi:sigma-70 family RNA polymerase sigma factor [Cyanobacterium aponinum UTEX 3222]|uniref:RNA polymerase, sigma subunit, ECF family n=2 Tax=Cyanobacterium aponinum TaxID=379064 RepID=K9Z2V3_CYAAP|nr:sigma-70 family RNA polymerase sigma factor [Cyanobacterium aponinum]WRL40853.1 sigma-70 family RNA polymerase sigma factor [Cyanobacterium aponinum UTEX 3222]AFZ52910.1 RNA polymerase, sigma subunit, ECF family [Cyanobacterium aponinum PCC 10605]MBD2394299.1 sigma-70 family RNA polymerase sigma factor [Cyanobacterium aponinum FACHB-4101]WPF90372.1 sigma-70 family RNA polymerase sigma factor [Cyanobacterium aponinum AL20115]WRL38853.1 sigma-70 family RNA polymerase sigma factor [Cyanobacter
MSVLADDYPEVADSDLVRNCQQGNKTSFRLLYQRYHHKVRATLYKLCGSEVLDDLQQEVFLKVWKSLPQLRNPKYFSTWLYRICWNVAYDQGSSKKRELQRHQANINQTKQSLEYSLAKSSNNHQELLKLHYQELVARGLQHLSLDHRAVIVLHDLEDLPQQEIAEILSIPLGTVKSRLFKARKNLRQFLELEGISL